MADEDKKNSQNDQTIEIARLQPAEIYQRLASRDQGLTTAEVEKRQKQFGKNILEKKSGESLFTKFIKNFTGLMAIMLWAAGLIAFVAQLTELGIAIWLVNIINGCFSFWQEYQAGKATDALQNMLPAHSRVIRDGKEIKILSADLVPGDVVKLEEGDDVPADIRLIASTDVAVDQSSLTGEVTPVHKQSGAVKAKADTNHFDLDNIVFSGTSMMKGNATGVVVKTGMQTDFGQIAALTQNVQEDLSPLQRELNTLTKQITVLAVSIGVVFFVVAIYFVHYPLVKSFVFALGMIVAFIPEGLEPTVTLSLAGAVQRMARHNALVKRLSSVETLGSASVICSDKTGTLTKNEMTVQHLWTPERDYTVTGEGYDAHGSIMAGPTDQTYRDNESLKELLLGGGFADDARIVAPTKDHPRYQILGDPTEACLEVVARKGGVAVEKEQAATPRIKELPFDSERKMMTVILKDKGTHRFDVYTKGAPNCVIEKCTTYLNQGKIVPLTAELKKQVMGANDGYAKHGLRVLAVAGRILPDALRQNLDAATIAAVEQGLTFIGLSVMMDTPRSEVMKAATECRNAHIKIIMVTGDYSLTAKSIARQIGLTDPDKPLVAVTGEQLKTMSDDELRQVLSGEVVFARMAPEQKYRIVDMLQQMGKTVAVTGDGVNDAPALKKADIGVAMGETGTDVAKEAADMILTDDNFSSIVTAIREGRGVYANIRKFLLYILNSNMPEAIPSVFFLLSGGRIPLALTVMEILFIDLGTDMLPALGLGRENPEPGTMHQPPRSRHSHLINRALLGKAFGWYGLWSSIIAMGGFFMANYLHGHVYPDLPATGFDYRQATTLALGLIIFCQVANVLNIRYQFGTMFNRHFLTNSMIFIGIAFEIVLLICVSYVPLLQDVFGTEALYRQDWLMLVCVPLPLILIDELRRWVIRRHRSL
ncbi:cation-translocating P-type ATPase [Limosilactobacillus sp.]|jgi:magnesium-transporting ATPase (P-type)|uniref:cation-translocating P-type ATPase n=1 Tax=Limosilactobacillus sp. TaxID=2773925 RepID=UPI0025B9E4B9|nr:cation-transporting P-type ATPase [Limosilactobacillus sp.]MCH3922069.1 cation-transporting P-type ATPase [Limosilactobacillus sp.]MCH3928840.1 cation-transporting P-type ATPase [Limosilactobacillus sp.]